MDILKPAPAGVPPAFDALPIDVLWEVVSYTDVSSAIKITLVRNLPSQSNRLSLMRAAITAGCQTSKLLYSLQKRLYFWLLLLETLKSIRPVPRLAERSPMRDVRQAVVTAHKLHIKWTVRRDATPARSYAIGRHIIPNSAYLSSQSRTLLLDDGLHLFHFDVDSTLKLRRISTGEVVWRLYLTKQPVGGLDYTFHEGDIILIFHTRIVEYIMPPYGDQRERRMSVWRYSGSRNCNPVYTLDIFRMEDDDITYGSFIRGTYAGCWSNPPGTQTLSVSNWLTGTYVSFEVTKAEGTKSATFTDTELLIVFQTRMGAVIYQYYLNTLSLHMTKTIPDTVPTLTPISPDGTYRVEFQGPDLRLHHEYTDLLLSSCKVMADGHIGLFSRTCDGDADCALLMRSAFLQWPPPNQECRPGADTLTMRAPAALVVIPGLSTSNNLVWTWSTAGKIMGIVTSTPIVDLRPLAPYFRVAIVLVDTNGVDSPEETGHRWEENAVATVFSAPASLPYAHKHYNYPLSVDIDEARGRMAVSAIDGSLVITEFV